MRVSEIMTHETDVCHPRDATRRAREIMRRYDLDGLPVVDPAGRLVGIVESLDVDPGATDAAEMVRDVMHAAPRCSPQEPIEEALAAMRTCHLSCLPVSSTDGTFLGVLHQKAVETAIALGQNDTDLSYYVELL